MSQKKNIVIGAALAGLSLGMLTATSKASAEDNVKCWGINKCGKDSKAKNKAACGVTEKHLAAAQEEFKDKFKDATVHECAAHAKCSAKKGNLNWAALSKKDCQKLKGFLIDDDGKIEKL